jgi:ATP-dependent helicase HrpA
LTTPATSTAKPVAPLVAVPVAKIVVNPDLPVYAHAEEIIAAIRAHQVIIVCGETGSGKTTQLPKLAWLAGRGQKKRIGMTEPRRIAARSVAQRLAHETETALGQFIGWKVRFTDNAGPNTRIKVMTDGILLAETQGDPRLLAYDTIILDEAHERSLNIDFILGFLHTLLPRRPDLKLILSSATLEADRFSKWFHNAPVIEVSGRSYPVEMRYRPIEARDEAEEADLNTAILHATDELAHDAPQGDILVFLPGEREIRDAHEALRKHHPEHTEILPLFSRLSVSEQDRIFQPHTGRRIILATNVAETSLTVPGIRAVIDTGLARVKRYSLKNRIEQLKVEKIAQAQANQRAGRCGRLGPGVCIRLYAEADFQARPAHPTPELLRSSLAGVILRMKALRLPEIGAFPFLDAPEPRRITDGQQLLVELAALDANQQLTPIGQQLAKLPLDPRIARILLAGHQHACLHETLVIASFLSVQDPRERPHEKAQAADEKHRRFQHPRSDFLAILNLWQHIDALTVHRTAHHLSQRKLRERLHSEFLSPLRLREWREVYNQLATLVRELGFPINETPHETPAEPDGDPWATRYAPIHHALLSGLLGNLGYLTEDGSYLGAREIRFIPFPGSSLGPKNRPKWIMAAEIVETRRVYARSVARIEPEWIEAAAAHLLKFSYSDPHWEKRPAQVNALQKATLYGLPIVNDRRIHYGPHDPALCHRLFILHALVRGEWDSRAPFFRHNLDLLGELDELGQRTRNAHIEVDEDRVAAFFAARIPSHIHTGASFDRWRRTAEQTQPRLLFLERKDLFPDQALDLDAYPEHLLWNDQSWRLAYRFEPGAGDDGVTLCAPIEALNQIPATRCEWLVPGLITAKIEALIRSLPQGLRRNFVPVPDYARAASLALHASDDALTRALADFLETRTGVRIPTDSWRPETLPLHLQMNFRLHDASGSTQAEGRDLAALRAAHGHTAQSELASVSAHLERDNITQWDFGDALGHLPEQIALLRGKQTLHAWPALAEEPDGRVALKPFDHRAAAEAAHRRGVLRLYWLGHFERLKQTHKTVAAYLKATALAYGLWRGDNDTLVRDILYAAALKLTPTDPASVRDRKAFDAPSKIPAAALSGEAERLAEIAADCIARTHALHGRLAKLPAQYRAAHDDIQQQLAALCAVGFIATHPPTRVQHLPRYLAGIEKRLEKLPRDPARDNQSMREMAPLIKATATLKDPRDFHWHLEELRVSLFAQELKTPEPVSVKRLEKRLAELRR